MNPIRRPRRDETVGPFRFGLTAALGVAVVVLAFLALQRAAGVLTVVTAAGFFAIGLNRPARWLIGRGLNRVWATWIIFGVVALVVCGGIGLVVPVLVEQTTALIESVPGVIVGLLDDPSIHRLIDTSDLRAWLHNLLTAENIGLLAGGLLGGAASLAYFVSMVLTALFLTFFILAGYDRIRLGAYLLVARSKRERVTALSDEILDKVGGYLIGALTIAALAGFMSLIFMLITGIPYATLLALVVAFFDLIPEVGATIGSLIVIAVALSEGLVIALIAAVFFIVYQQLENFVVYPRIMHRAVRISNLAAIVAVLVGFSIFGVVGVFIAVPGLAAIQLLIRELVFPHQERH